MYTCEVSSGKVRETGGWFLPPWLEVCCLQKEMMPLSLPTYPDWAQLSQDSLNSENILSFSPSINVLSEYLLLGLLVSTLLCSYCNDSSLGNTHDTTHFLSLRPRPSSDQLLHGSHICLLKHVFFLVIPFNQAFLGFLAYGAKPALQQGV